MARYRFAANGGTYGEPHGLILTLAKVSSVCKRDGKGFRYKPPGSDWGKIRSGRVIFLAAVGKWLRRLAVDQLGKVATRCETPTELGPTYLIRRVKAVKRTPPPSRNELRYYSGAVVDLNDGNPRVAGVALFVARTFPRAMCSGYKFTRFVAGTTVYSQHSAWAPLPGYSNAIDITVYNNDDPTKGTDMAATRNVAIAVVAQAKLGNLKLHRVIFGDQDWRLDHGWSPIAYTGEFHTHVHSEGEPDQTGTPVDA